jgi:hypothetical protein
VNPKIKLSYYWLQHVPVEHERPELPPQDPLGKASIVVLENVVDEELEPDSEQDPNNS